MNIFVTYKTTSSPQQALNGCNIIIISQPQMVLLSRGVGTHYGPQRNKTCRHVHQAYRDDTHTPQKEKQSNKDSKEGVISCTEEVSTNISSYFRCLSIYCGSNRYLHIESKIG